MDRTRKLPYEMTAKNQPTIVILNDGRLGNGKFGPWIEWRFPWEEKAKVTHTAYWEFEEMVRDAGYK